MVSGGALHSTKRCQIHIIQRWRSKCVTASTLTRFAHWQLSRKNEIRKTTSTALNDFRLNIESANILYTMLIGVHVGAIQLEGVEHDVQVGSDRLRGRKTEEGLGFSCQIDGNLLSSLLMITLVWNSFYIKSSTRPPCTGTPFHAQPLEKLPIIWQLALPCF